MALTPEELEYRQKISNKYLGILSPMGEALSDEDYPGPYDVTPYAFKDQTLKTAGKTLSKDIIVREVPFRETTNVGGGLTAYIANT